jgi:hypothetical protein
VSDIIWTNEKRKLGDLIAWSKNPRQITKDEAKRLEKSLEEFGQIQTIAIGPDNSIYDGHQRDLVWSASSKFGKNYEVDVRVSSRLLTEKEREKLVISLHAAATGEWNWDQLSSWNASDLTEWGMDEELQSVWKRDIAALNSLLDSEEELKEETETLRPKEYARVLISIPVDQAIEAKEIIDSLSEIDGIEIDYGAN